MFERVELRAAIESLIEGVLIQIRPASRHVDRRAQEQCVIALERIRSRGRGRGRGGKGERSESVRTGTALLLCEG